MDGMYATNMSIDNTHVQKKINRVVYQYSKTGEPYSFFLGNVSIQTSDNSMALNELCGFKSLYITYSGNIYNIKSIRNELIKLGYIFNNNSDDEVILIGYFHWREKILEKMNGDFALIIYDCISEKVFCARDRLGVKPLYYYYEDEKLEICSNLNLLINKDSKISEEAVSIYLDCGYVPSPYSILENVYKLQPGKFMVIDLINKTKKITEYWNIKNEDITNISYDEAKNKLHKLLRDAVNIRIDSQSSFGVFLSGGIDSALVTALVAENNHEKVRSFTIGFEDSNFDESKIAEKFSSILSTDQTIEYLNASDILNMLSNILEVYDEPFADSSALPTMLLNKITKQYVPVALSGDGGDESFLGYKNFDLMSKLLKIQRIPFFVRKSLTYLPVYKFLNIKKSTFNSFLVDNPDEFSLKLFTGFESLQKNKSSKWLENYNEFKNYSSSPFQRMADLGIKLWLENDSNVKVDRASTAHSVDIRSPFLDYRVVEFARKLPIDYRYQKNNKKRITKDILSLYIPQEVFDLPKKGFSIPLADWLRNELYEDVSNTLNDDLLNSIPNLNTKLFKKQFNLHMKGKNDYSFNIWKIYILALWLKKFENQVSLQ